LGKGAEDATIKEVRQMMDKNVWTGQAIQDLAKKQMRCIIRCHMNFKEKYLPDGTFE
jgi:hypothetical protein